MKIFLIKGSIWLKNNKNEQMKTIQHIVKAVSAILIITIASMPNVYAQDSKKDKESAQIAAVKNWVDAKDYVFVAQSVSPLRGRTRQLTSGYDLRVSADTVISYLPFFGRAFTAPINPAEGGINFTSTDFEYTAAARKKGGWDIVIKPKDVNDIQQFLLTIYDNGNALLTVNSNNKDAISYSGYIRARDQK